MAALKKAQEDLASTQRAYNERIAGLQTAQGTIKTTTEELDRAKKAGQTVIDESIAALKKAQEDLASTQRAYNERIAAVQAAQQSLETSQMAYEARLQELRAAQVPR